MDMLKIRVNYIIIFYFSETCALNFVFLKLDYLVLIILENQ